MPGNGVCIRCRQWVGNHDPDCELWVERLQRSLPHMPVCLHFWRDRHRHAAEFEPVYVASRRLCDSCSERWDDRLREFYDDEERYR